MSTAKKVAPEGKKRAGAPESSARGPSHVHGRASLFSTELAAVICGRLAQGESLRSICRDAGMPDRSTVAKWVIDDVGGFSSQYARAREVGLDELADEALEIANTPVEGVRREESADGHKEVREDMLGHRKLQVDTRKWLLSKLAPKKYGERAALELTGEGGGPVQFSDADRAAKLAGLLALAQARKAAKTGDDVSDLV